MTNKPSTPVLITATYTIALVEFRYNDTQVAFDWIMGEGKDQHEIFESARRKLFQLHSWHVASLATGLIIKIAAEYNSEGILINK
jgi:hypothetical protein